MAVHIGVQIEVVFAVAVLIEKIQSLYIGLAVVVFVAQVDAETIPVTVAADDVAEFVIAVVVAARLLQHPERGGKGCVESEGVAVRHPDSVLAAVTIELVCAVFVAEAVGGWVGTIPTGEAVVVIAAVVVGVALKGIVCYQAFLGDVVGNIGLADREEVGPKTITIPPIGRPQGTWVVGIVVTPVREDIAVVGDGFDGEFGVSGVTA